VSIDIHQYLPHQKPMLMVDEILDISENGVECVFEIKPDNVFVENGLFSEAGLIENAAQTSSSIVAQSFFSEKSKKSNVIGFVSSIRKISIYEKPAVGDTIFTHATLLSRFDGENYTTCRVECKTFHKETLILEGEINLFIQDQLNEKGRSPSG
jgi:predicted hotdog family 3-hydroxylacyl-ACP dehydratase